MSDIDRLAVPFENGSLSLQEPVLVMRGEGRLPSVFAEVDVTVEHGFKPVIEALESRGVRVTPAASGQFGTACVVLTRDKTLNFANIARAASLADTVVVSGSKTDGVESVLKGVKKRLEVTDTLSKAHGKVFWFSSEGVDLSDWAEAGKPSRKAHGYTTAPGMFSPDKIDKGSEILAGLLADRLKGKVADLGAGWGYLAAQALAGNPAIEQLDLYEAEYAALEAAKINVTDPRAVFHWADVAALKARLEGFNFVIANPPFHVSRTADPQLGQAFIRSAARILKASGQYLMVANRQLAYEGTLDQAFGYRETLYQDGLYKVILARKPKGRI